MQLIQQFTSTWMQGKMILLRWQATYSQAQPSSTHCHCQTDNHQHFSSDESKQTKIVCLGITNSSKVNVFQMNKTFLHFLYPTDNLNSVLSLKSLIGKIKRCPPPPLNIHKRSDKQVCYSFLISHQVTG
jgi:hypothetical protein